MYRGGGAYKEQKKFANILDYLEVHHPEVYELLDHTGLRPRLIAKGRFMVTFIVPDSATVKNLVAMVKKGTAENDDIEKAVEMLSCYILIGLYKHVSDFKEREDDITTALGKKLEIKDAAANSGKVVLKNGTELTCDKKFVQISKSGKYAVDNSAVWTAKGPVDCMNAPDSEYTYANERPKERTEKSGADEPAVDTVIARNIKHADEIRLDYERSFTTVCRVLNYWLLHREQHMRCLLTARALFGPNMYYNVFILLRLPDVFDPVSVSEGIERGIDDKNYTNFTNFCKTDSNSDGSLATKCDRTQFERLQTKLLNLIDAPTLSPGEKAKKIAEIYTAVDNNNSYDRMSNIYPAHLAQVFSANPGMHLCIDEIRYNLFLIHPKIYGNLVNRTTTDVMSKSDIYDTVVRIYRGLSYRKSCVGFISTIAGNPLSVKGDVNPKLNDFVRKGFVLGCCAAKYGGDDEDDSDDDGESVYEDKNASMDDSEFKLSDSCLTELRAYAAKHGDADINKLLGSSS